MGGGGRTTPDESGRPEEENTTQETGWRARVGTLGAQAWTVTKLTAKLLVLILPQSPWWMVMVVRLMLFSLAVSPALASSAWYWFRRPVKNVAYGPGLRHTLDVFLPRNKPENAPMVVFLTGGAWVIGYKAWAVPLGRALSAQGVVVVAPDYRNAPQAPADGMLADCDLAVQWAFEHAASLGADPRRIVLAGQSAGAHLSALLLLRKAEARYFGAEEKNDKNPNPKKNWIYQPWAPDELAGFWGISGPYHLEATATHWIARGLSRGLFDTIFGGNVQAFSPTDECLRVLDRLEATTRKQKQQPFGAFLPRIRLAHGTADQSAPSVTSELFEARLKLLGARVDPTLKYKNWTHTDPILEKPFAGDHTLHADLFHQLHLWRGGAPKIKQASGLLTASSPSSVLFWGGPRTRDHASSGELDTTCPVFDASHPDCRRLAPSFLIAFGRWCMPF